MKISDEKTTRSAAAQSPGKTGSKDGLPAFGASRLAQGGNPQPKDTLNKTPAPANPPKGAKPDPDQASKPQSTPEKSAPRTGKSQTGKNL